MEIGVGNGCCSRRSEKESTNLGDLLLIQINDHQNSLSKLQTPSPVVQSNPTLLDVIREDVDPNKKNKKKMSWKSFTEKLGLQIFFNDDVNIRISAADSRSSKINVEFNLPLPEVGKSLMELMEGEDEEENGELLQEVGMALFEDTYPEMEEEEGMELNKWCCVCMVREKGAAFIPCGHAFCRLCSREIWVEKGTCPLCNVFIVEILHIF